MSVVAELLVSRGAVVAGSDREESQVLDHLRSVGVRVDVGHDASHVDPEAVVVVSSAIREDNPELAVARRRGQLVIHRSQALALAASGMRFVAVAGGDDRLPRVRFEGASRVEAISAACREAASEASSAVVFERAGERDSGKKTSVGRRDGISVCASGMSACRPLPKPRFFWAITSPQRRRAR